MHYFHVTADSYDFGLVQAVDEQHARDRAARLAGYRDEADVVATAGAPSTIKARRESTIIMRGREVAFQAVIDQMDSELRARVYARVAPCGAQVLVNEYVREHARVFGHTLVVGRQATRNRRESQPGHG